MNGEILEYDDDKIEDPEEFLKILNSKIDKPIKRKRRKKYEIHDEEMLQVCQWPIFIVH